MNSSSGSQIESGTGTHIISAKVRKTIQTIKEIVGDHSDADIYVALKDSNMDPNETAQKLLNQDPFREVKRRRDKKKENMGYKGSAEPDARRQPEDTTVESKFNNFAGQNARRGGYSRNLPGAGVSREFRVVRDNRVNPAKNREWKPASPKAKPEVEKTDINVPQKGSTWNANSKKPSGRSGSFQGSNQPNVSQTHRVFTELRASSSKKAVEENGGGCQNGVSSAQAEKPKNAHIRAGTQDSNNSAIGVYSSSTDPVHVPSPDSRSSSAIGAIRREVGVGGRRRSTESPKPASVSSSSVSNSPSGVPNSSESLRPFATNHKSEQFRQSPITESVIQISQANRPFVNNHHSNKSHQAAGHQKASQANKEWKPKSVQKSNPASAGVIGAKSTSPAKNCKDVEQEAMEIPDKFSQISINENQNVIIADHIRVLEADRCRLKFGSFGTEFDSCGTSLSGSHAARASEESNQESATSLSVAATGSSTGEASVTNLGDAQNNQVGNPTSESPASDVVYEHQLPDKEVSAPQNPQDIDSYADIGLVQENSPSCTPTESQQQQEHPNLPSFSQGYDPQTGYDIPYFRQMADEGMVGQGLAQESLSSHMATSGIPASTVTMVQQQHQPVTQMYPPVQVSHFTLPYRQFLSPVYVPPMAMPGYSSNTAYPHPSNGSSYLLMPGGSSHLGAGGLKYGIQQYKPVATGNPTGFGNFTSPAGYAMNAPGVVGGATGLEDSSRMKYKDGNLYAQNPQAETSELWIQNPRELSGLQSAPYYNMPGQTPHAAYLPSHTGHASYNAVAAPSSHMPFPGLYHPPQPTAIPSHHLGPTMGNNVQVGVAAAAPGAQVGSYQQPPQMGINWTGNF